MNKRQAKKRRKKELRSTVDYFKSLKDAYAKGLKDPIITCHHDIIEYHGCVFKEGGDNNEQTASEEKA